ncbi:uncharacterized protein MKZ38_003876 [Zalerion maritima]|uniref:Uncharacterized protein n=1 Tax=Zalerion maritima TaxID=339359 RepID=A0AAD5WXH5_9PEZI|nr:uncharacterized protein MKZ38_003876 [Zalerion maritima]
MADPQASAPAQPTLIVLNKDAADQDAIDTGVPTVLAVREGRNQGFDLKSISHVVVQISDARQEQVFRSIGYQFDSNRPTPYWYFLGKLAAQALFSDPAELLLLNYVRVRTREFIGFTTATWSTASKEARTTLGDEPPPLIVVEVDFKRPQPGKPLEAFWKPATGLITERIRQWSQEPGKMDLSREVEL